VSCEEHHCVTCADEGVPMRVLEVGPDGLAHCENDVEVMTELVGRVHAGVALARLT